MGISGNSGFQEPPKVSISDVINFQIGAKTLQTSFAKALQETDVESVVIVNIHQPIQSTQAEISNARVRKNTKKKRTSLNQQIRDMIQKSIRTSKHSNNTRAEESIENEAKGMFIIDHNRGANKQLKDLEDKIRESKIRENNNREVRQFKQNMCSPSYNSSLDTNFETEIKQKPQELKKNTPKTVESEQTFEIPDMKEIPKKEEFIVAEVVDNKLTERDIEEESDNKEVLSESEPSMTPQQTRTDRTDNILAPLSSLTTVASSSSISPHCIMSLPPDFFELFEKLVGIMIIEQNTSGITDVTVVINKPGSPLDKSEVLLQFFDTNPRSCNVELRGSPEAVHYFHKYHGEFMNAFRESKLSLDVNIRGPALLRDKKVIRKEKRG